jgi:aminopeptidase N
LASLASSPSDLALLSGLLDGSAYMDGLVVDTELRWRLLHRLVSQGAAGPAEIDAELRRDPTDAGERRAATCRAAIPEPAAKEAAWQAIVSGTLPNAMFRATLNGFSDPDQADLLAPYATRYFEVVGDVWQNWSSDMAQGFATNAYPLTQISERTVELTDAYIAEADPPAALRRLLLEGRDSLQRALRCQARDRLEHAA